MQIVYICVCVLLTKYAFQPEKKAFEMSYYHWIISDGKNRHVYQFLHHFIHTIKLIALVFSQNIYVIFRWFLFWYLSTARRKGKFDTYEYEFQVDDISVIDTYFSWEPSARLLAICSQQPTWMESNFFQSFTCRSLYSARVFWKAFFDRKGIGELVAINYEKSRNNNDLKVTLRWIFLRDGDPTAQTTPRNTWWD